MKYWACICMCVCVPISTSSKGAIVVKSIIRLASEINGLFIRTFSRLYGNKQIQMAIKTTKQMPKRGQKLDDTRLLDRCLTEIDIEFE